MYFRKYMKYKKKYLNAKEKIRGGGGLSNENLQ